MLKVKKVFLSGKIDGDPEYLERFELVERFVIEDFGHDVKVLNPTVLPLGFDHEDYMTICFAMVDVCDTVVLLPTWQDSEGARLEMIHAVLKNKNIMFYRDGKFVSSDKNYVLDFDEGGISNGKQ